jgi:hypothetical protein
VACLFCDGRGYGAVKPGELDRRASAEANQARIANGQAPLPLAESWLERNGWKIVGFVVVGFLWCAWQGRKAGPNETTPPDGPASPPSPPA